jgi:isopenicillin N synthase-like dioxygenase
MRAQNFEGKGKGDLKEGFYFGRDLPLDHPSAQKGTFGCGPNVYPEGVSNPAHFRNTIALYHATMSRLAQDVLQVLALTLDLSPNAFDEFGENALAILRLLHYPPQPPDASEDEKGIGAHTDFGGITLLLQDDVGGLQVYDSPTLTWIDVAPTPGAYVVNLGNLMMRWTNDRYFSNLHRVINISGRERYSIPFFFSGNPDYVVKCLPGGEEDGKGQKYEPITVEDWMRGRYAATYGTTDKPESDMVQEAGKS